MYAYFRIGEHAVDIDARSHALGGAVKTNDNVRFVNLVWPSSFVPMLILLATLSLGTIPNFVPGGIVYHQKYTQSSSRCLPWQWVAVRLHLSVRYKSNHMGNTVHYLRSRGTISLRIRIQSEINVQNSALPIVGSLTSFTEAASIAPPSCRSQVMSTP